MFVRLKTHCSDILPERLKGILSKYKYTFNPSFVENNNARYLAVRVNEHESDVIISLLFVWSNEDRVQIINLTEYFENHEDGLKVSDPKLFIMNGNLWGTFNSGYTENHNNSVVLFEIKDSNVGKYYFCDYAQRSYVEKNWAFYMDNDELYTLYSISPLIVLKAKVFNGKRIAFEQYFLCENTKYSSYSIGTPMVSVNNEFLFVAHKKVRWMGKRLYIGRPFIFTHAGGGRVKARKLFLIHSIAALFGSAKKFNANLISCTYFSGINFKENKIQLSYGINDVKLEIISIERNELWH